MADGSVQFISQSIDTGNQTIVQQSNAAGMALYGGPSNYGVWGALGTRNGGEPNANVNN
jgi:hypothetical protein